MADDDDLFVYTRKKGKICDERCTLELERPMECVICLQFLTRFFFLH